LNIISLKIAQKILDWLTSLQIQVPGYDHGGILDPLDGRVIGDHYSTTHFAWACALYYKKTGLKKWFERAVEAINFHIRTSPDEYKFGQWAYHWDFNNLAFIETYDLLKKDLSLEDRKNWEEAILAWKTNTHHATNWLAMRALAAYKRGILFKRKNDFKDAKDWLGEVLAAQRPDGGIDDVKGESCPAQYHAYTAALVYQLLPFEPSVKKFLLKAAQWLLAITAPDGDMNIYGRGQGQIFGYACAIYLFLATSNLDHQNAPYYLWIVKKNLERLERFQHSEGWIPLVLNSESLSTRAGWYDYHHITVYNAFVAVWLLLAADLKVPKYNVHSPYHKTIFFPKSGILVIHEKNFFTLWAGGEKGAGYAVEAGITPHAVYVDEIPIFKYPLGPALSKYGKNIRIRNQIENLWASLVKNKQGQWIAPFGEKGKIRKKGKSWILTYKKEGIFWKRRVLIKKYFMEVSDSLILPKDIWIVRPINFSARPDRIQQISSNFIYFDMNNALLKIHSNLSHIKILGETVAADGKVLIIGNENKIVGPTTFNISWRLRRGPKNKKGKIPGIVCFSWDPWSSLWKRKQKLLFEMAKTGKVGKVLYVEPSVSSTKIFEHLKDLFKKNDKGKRFRRALRKGPIKINNQFFLLTPLLPFPGHRSFRTIRLINNFFLNLQILKAIYKLQLKGYILWLYHPSHLFWLKFLGHNAELTVYDWTDDWVAAYPKDRPIQEKERLKFEQEELLKRVEVIFTVSKKLEQRAQKFSPWVYYLPNATDPRIFKPFNPSVDRIHSLIKKFKRPILVYLSQITDRVDFQLLTDIAQKRPEWNILLIGPIVCSKQLIAPLQKLSNIHFVGALPYKEAAKLVAQADVCILPHKMSNLTMTLDPIKIYDYLATGRPIVSTKVAIHPDLQNIVYIAKNSNEFIEKVQKALKTSQEEINYRRKIALSHTWEKRATEAIKFLQKFFD